MNIKLVLEYDGSGFCGWQYQPEQRSVQGVLQDSLSRLTGEEIKLHGAGRTDAGVHALAQTASFKTASTVPPERFKPALNRLLPSDVRVHQSHQVPEDFHARYSSVGKTYMYKIVQGEFAPPLLRNRVWAVRRPLDLDSMQVAVSCLLGTHDFRGFCAGGSSVQSTVRTVTSVKLIRDEEDKGIDLFISADGFLYNMVRIIVAGTVRVGSGQSPANIFEQALAVGNRSILRYTAPSQGLYLVRVEYGGRDRI